MSEALIEQAQRVSKVTQQAFETVLLDALEVMGLTWENFPEESLPTPVTNLSDEEVLALASLKMEYDQNERLAKLQTKGKTTGLTEAERYELLALLQVYQLGQLRKSEALAEAVKRGLREPLSS
ncbi:MAG: hypothetical protein SAK29_16360 [Scytonema sp. PMC 1069.18]|nr:hypothetical protein [Scytonema sp. PMC 1069.18]MEC4883398.1 hypothetical protein [Scytonema sp. PMC 1070.18]